MQTNIEKFSDIPKQAFPHFFSEATLPNAAFAHLDNILYLCRRIGSGAVIRPAGLKGNQVKFLNSPAAVKLVNSPRQLLFATDAPQGESGRRPGESQSEDLPFIKGCLPRGLGIQYENIFTDISIRPGLRKPSVRLYVQDIFLTNNFYVQKFSRVSSV